MFAYNNSISLATDLAPIEVYISRLPRLLLAVFDRSNGGSHQSLARDQLAYCDLARECQQQACEVVRERHTITVARVDGRNSALSGALLCRPTYTVSGWIWMYNTAVTIQGARKGTNDTEKPGPFKVLAVGPSAAKDTPDGRLLGAKRLHLDLSSHLSGHAAKARVTVVCCKPCTKSYDTKGMPRYSPTGLTQYTLHSFATKFQPYHVTTEDVTTPPVLVQVDKITGHQCVRGRGGAIAVI